MSVRKSVGVKNELFVPANNLDAISTGSGDEGDTDIRKKIKYGNRLQAAWALMNDFTSNSTVHGVRYFTEKKRHWSERIWWIIAFTLSAVACGFLIFNVYLKWVQSPVIVSFAEKSTPIWEIPFPSVTICPETKTYMDKLNFTDVFNKLRFNDSLDTIDDVSMRRMETIIQLCDTHIATSNFKIGSSYENSSFFDVLTEMAPGYNDTMWFCKWRNVNGPCFDYFQTILTDEGVCYTFNNLNSNDIYTDEMAPEMMIVTGNKDNTHWNLQDGYSNSVPTNETYPHRVFGAGARAGFFALLKLNDTDAEYVCRGPVQGFKVLLHIPGEVPQVSKHYFRVPLLEEVLISVKPNMITTSENLRHYTPWERQCYFSDERDLRFFKIYTQRNCELECLSNFTLAKCGCVKFSNPRDRYAPICGATNIECYNQAEDVLLEQFFKDGLDKNKIKDESGCNCLPACTSIAYDAEISQAKFDWVSLFNALLSPVSEFPGAAPARLSIYFKEHQFITSKRSELYGLTDFLGACGGLLGLFMGVSVLSIVECIYYFTLRLGCSLQMRRLRKRKSLRRSLQKHKITPADKDICDIPNITIVSTDEKKD